MTACKSFGASNRVIPQPLGVVGVLLATLLFGWAAFTKLHMNASFEKMIPTGHPYIQNFLKHRSDLRGMGNSLRVVVENTEGDIFDPDYLGVLKQAYQLARGQDGAASQQPDAGKRAITPVAPTAARSKQASRWRRRRTRA